MQEILLRRISATLACIIMLILIACSGGSGSGGGGENAYTLRGSLTGLSTGQSVSLQDGGGDQLTLSANGAFSFPTRLEAGVAYAVTVQSHTPGIACSVSNGTGTVGSSNGTAIAVSCTAGTERILYSFGANATDGQQPYAGVMVDSAGNVFGTTQNGGVSSIGTVFKITAAGTETILHSFGASATDGQIPRAGVVMDKAGNLYGTTSKGGAYQLGTVFKIDAAGTETILYSFGSRPADGAFPEGNLIIDSTGNLYGTTPSGGPHGTGTVYKLDPAGTETILYSFGIGNADGTEPYGSLLMDSAGNLYGTTGQGGAYFEGAVFRLSPDGTETILHSFGTGSADGLSPMAGLTVDSVGNLYGTTVNGGPNFGTITNGLVNGGGTVFVID